MREEYNDNIYLSHSSKVDDFITTISPGVNFAFKTDRAQLSVNYGLNFLLFAKHSENNRISLDQAQRAQADTTLTLVKDILFLRLSDAYTRVPIDQRKPVAFDNIIVNMTNTNSFQANPYLVYPLSSTVNTRVSYRYENIWYMEAAGNDTENHTAEVSLSKEFSRDLSTSLSYSYLMYRPAKTHPYDNQTVSLGANWQLSPRISLNGSVGDTFFNYKSADRKNTSSIIWRVQANYLMNDRLTLGGGYSEDYTGSVNQGTYRGQSEIAPLAYEGKPLRLWQASANYLMSDRLTLGAGYSESYADSVSQGTYKSQSATATLAYQGRMPLRLSLHRTNSKYTDFDREDRSTGVEADCRIPLGISPRLSSHLSGSYSSYEFLPEKEKVDRYSARLAFEYEMNVTVLSFGYTFNANDSSIGQNSYTNNILFAQAKFTY